MEAIGYRVVECALGRLLVAGTSRGVCNVRFGDDPQQLVAGLAAEFPYAEVEPDAERLGPWVEALLRYLRGEAHQLEVPLDVRGSQFQRRVWSAIAAIPYGATRSYGELAAGIGQPGAARAVAQACGANPVALQVPCPRVVGASGRLGGYRYGVARKRALLDAERERAADSGPSGAQPPPATAMPNWVPPSGERTIEMRAVRPPFAATTSQWATSAVWDSSSQPAPGSSFEKNSKTASGSLSTSKATIGPEPGAAKKCIGRESG